MESKQGNGVFKLFEIAQKHISEKVGASYPIMKAQELAEEAEKLGFGKLEASHTPSRGGRTSKHFRKRSLEELDENCIDLLKRKKITEPSQSHLLVIQLRWKKRALTSTKCIGISSHFPVYHPSICRIIIKTNIFLL